MKQGADAGDTDFGDAITRRHVVTRRSLLASVALLTGCVGSDSSDTDDSPTETDRSGRTDTAVDPSGGNDTGDANGSSADGGDTEPASPDGTPTDSSDDLDLREANVMAVEWDGSPGGEVDFSVTLYHDDEGEDGYANWWQVETVAGAQLGRRKLLHAHRTREFTRSATIAVPGDVDRVVVRGHDQTHGYGGRAMTVAFDSGETTAVDQGPEKESFG